MKYILTTFAFITALLCLTPWVQAVEVGDIFYHDGSFDKTVKDDKGTGRPGLLGFRTP